MRVRVDTEVCTGHGRCYMLAPAVFGEDDRGHCVVLQPEVKGDLEDKARLGAEACPEQAIDVSED